MTLQFCLQKTCLSSKTTPTSTSVVVPETISSRDLNVYNIVFCYFDWLTTLSCPLLIGRTMNTLTLYFFCQICIHIRDKQNNNVLIQHFTSRYRLVGNLRRLVVTTIVRRHEGDQNSQFVHKENVLKAIFYKLNWNHWRSL